MVIEILQGTDENLVIVIGQFGRLSHHTHQPDRQLPLDLSWAAHEKPSKDWLDVATVRILLRHHLQLHLRDDHPGKYQCPNPHRVEGVDQLKTIE